MLKPVARLSTLAVMLSLTLAACQSSPVGGSPSASSVASTQRAASTQSPTATALPLVAARPSDIPTDGTCEQGYDCLGLLKFGKRYQTKIFKPQITFSVPSNGWENLSEEGGAFELLPVNSPGDAIAFFMDPGATTPDGKPATGVGDTVSQLSSWLASNTLLHVTPAKAVTAGGLKGVTSDISIAAGATSHYGDCPIQTCVSIFRGVDPSKFQTWAWDWGSGGPETQRLYLLSSPDGVLALFIDSFDGTTFDAMTTAADQIIATLKFG